MPKMRAKMQIQSVEQFEHGEKLRMFPVCGKAPFGPNGESEDNTYARFTPSGSLELQINNPDLAGKFKPGQRFYVDFTETE